MVPDPVRHPAVQIGHHEIAVTQIGHRPRDLDEVSAADRPSSVHLHQGYAVVRQIPGLFQDPSAKEPRRHDELAEITQEGIQYVGRVPDGLYEPDIVSGDPAGFHQRRIEPSPVEASDIGHHDDPPGIMGLQGIHGDGGHPFVGDISPAVVFPPGEQNPPAFYRTVCQRHGHR